MAGVLGSAYLGLSSQSTRHSEAAGVMEMTLTNAFTRLEPFESPLATDRIGLARVRSHL